MNNYTTIKINSKGYIKLPLNITKKFKDRICFLKTNESIVLYSIEDVEKLMNMFKERYKQHRISREEYKLMNRIFFSRLCEEEVNEDRLVKFPIKTGVKEYYLTKNKEYTLLPKKEI